MVTVRSPQLCSRCQSLPQKIEGAGNLYLWFPLPHSFAKTARSLQQSSLSYQIKDEECLVVSLQDKQMEHLVSTLAKDLTHSERQQIKALFTAHPSPQLQDFPRTASLASFISQSQSGWLLDMLAAERVTSQFQPIAYTADLSQIFGQEALLRGISQDGSLISPSCFLPLAAEANILTQIDLLARYSAIRQAKQHQIQERIFINFMPTAIYDPAFCLRSTIEAIDDAGIAHEQVVFEVVESAYIEDFDHLKKILDVYREAGFSVALDDFGAGFSNLNLLHQLRPELIKLDMNLIRNVHRDPYKALVTEKILEIATHLNISTVAEGIESPEELTWVRARGATFVQGFLIAKPSTLPVKKLPPTAAESLKAS
ncbi:MAG: EAL domain-containing protein [Cyanophyceae cyanobacterium]